MTIDEAIRNAFNELDAEIWLRDESSDLHLTVSVWHPDIDNHPADVVFQQFPLPKILDGIIARYIEDGCLESSADELELYAQKIDDLARMFRAKVRLALTNNSTPSA